MYCWRIFVPDDFVWEDFFREDFFREDFFREDFFRENFFQEDFERKDFVWEDFLREFFVYNYFENFCLGEFRPGGFCPQGWNSFTLNFDDFSYPPSKKDSESKKSDKELLDDKTKTPEAISPVKTASVSVKFADKHEPEHVRTPKCTPTSQRKIIYVSDK